MSGLYRCSECGEWVDDRSGLRHECPPSLRELAEQLDDLLPQVRELCERVEALEEKP